MDPLQAKMEAMNIAIENSLGESSGMTPDPPEMVEKLDMSSGERGVVEEDSEVRVAHDVTQIQMAVGSDPNKTLESNSEALKRILNANKGVIDTAAPFDSVKDAVSKFGGIVDWKAHKVMALEKHTHIQSELERTLEDLPRYRKRSEEAELVKEQILEELDCTKKLVEELKDGLEKSRTEEAQAKQDSELAQLRVREMEQGISDYASAAAKAQMEVAKDRHKSAVEELRSVKEELEGLQGDYHRLIAERDVAVARAEEAVSAAKDAEKKAEDLTLELISIKEALEMAHASHLEAEERRIAITMVRDQDVLVREKELSQAKEELKQLADQHLCVEDLRSKFEAASTMLLNLKTELAFYMEERFLQAAGMKEDAQSSIPSDLASAKKEIDDIKTSIDKAKDEVNCLREAASSLKTELSRETETVATLKQRQELASATVSSLEAELSRMQSELELVLTKEREAREKAEGLPRLMQQAAYDADQAKTVAQLAGEELEKAKEQAEQARAGASAMEARLLGAQKETESAKASEALAVAAVRAMEASEQKQTEPHDAEASTESKGVTLQLEEYYKLSKDAHDAEEAANERVLSAVEKVKEAKDSEQMSMQKLEEACKLLEEKKEALRLAVEMADKETEGKLTAEQELREWRAETEQRRRASDAAAPHLEKNPSENASEYSDERGEPNMLPGGQSRIASMSCPDLYADPAAAPDLKQRRKKSFFPRIVMFLARKKAQTLK